MQTVFNWTLFCYKYTIERAEVSFLSLTFSPRSQAAILEECPQCIRGNNWRASVASETLTGVTQLKTGDVCLFVCIYVWTYVCHFVL